MKSMVNLFEKDSNDLKKYFKAISSSCQKIMNAQVFLNNLIFLLTFN